MRRLPVGAEFSAEGATLFRVWAPKRSRVEVVLPEEPAEKMPRSFALRAEPGGYFSGSVPGLAAGARYAFRLDDDPRFQPDPASRFQPDGPEGFSQLVDPHEYRWSDDSWKGARADGQVVYEMHIGTCTPQGTWTAAAAQLPELARCGMTIVEVMPVADFHGKFGWGYDGVCLFAPTRLYGEPNDFRRFVDRAHAEGLGVILDVVYNHFGTVGHTIPQFSEYFRAEHYANEWGDAINFDGEHSRAVREFFLANVRYWITEFHLDGLRFDATQAIHDQSESHILTELVDAARDAAGNRSLFLVAENELQDVRMVRPVAAGGHAMDALWNDDFQHAAHVRLTGCNEAYYSDFQGNASELLAAVKRGFVYQGQLSQWQKKPRGTPTKGLPASAFVTFLENHDQVANSGLGARLAQLTSPGRLRAMTALWLLSPQTPMFFQGQEFGASAPFLYFADNVGDQRRLVAEGRGKFLGQFPSLASAEAQARLSDPADRSTFERCRLNLSERESHAQTYALHLDLLRLRREDAIFSRQQIEKLDGIVIGPDCVVVRYFSDSDDDRLLIVNFGRDLKLAPLPEPLIAPPADCHWTLLWSSEEPEYGGSGTAPFEIENAWHIAGEAALVLKSSLPAES